MSKKFYTNVEVRGDYILYHGYEDGLPVKKKIPYAPHLFVPSQTKTEWTAFSTKEYVKKKTFKGITDMREFIKQYEDVDNFNIFGCDNIIRQYIANEFQGDIVWDYYQTQIWFVDIETKVGTGFAEPVHADQDIQLITMMDHHAKKVFTWSTIPLVTKTLLDEFDIEFKYFESEKEMLKDFIVFWASTRIDVISGWNSVPFDIPYIINRIKKVLSPQAANLLSPWKVLKERIVTEDERTYVTYDILGITHLDYLEIYKKFNPSGKESFKLDHIAEIELGKNKLPLPGDTFKESYEGSGDEFELPSEDDIFYDLKMKRYRRSQISEQLETNPELQEEYDTLDKEIRLAHGENFIKYNIIDVHLLHELEVKMLQVRLAMQVGFMAKTNFGDVVSAMRVWESIIYSYFLDQKIVEDLKKVKKERKKIVGAFVLDPVPGKRKWTISIDATALYPSIMMQHNTSPESIVDMVDMTIENMLKGKHEGTVADGTMLSANGLVTSKETPGFISILIKRMFDLRKETKNHMLDLKKANAPEQEWRALDVSQGAFKIAANSFYGITAMAFFRYYDSRIAEAITSNGQVFIIKTKQYVDEIFTKIMGKSDEYTFYMDTDSVVGDTLVYVNGEKIKISDLFDQIQADSLVPYSEDTQNFVKPVTNMTTLSFNTKTESVEEKPIKHVMKHRVKKRMFKIFALNDSVNVTEDHSVIVKRDCEYISVKPIDMIPGKDFVTNVFKEKTSNFQIEDLGVQEIDVFDIEVDENHNFFANDILVHNSAYINVDSLVQKYCQGKTDQEIVDYIESFVFKVLQPALNKKLSAFAKTMGVDDCKISFKLECIGNGHIQVAKKRYVFDILYSEGVRYDKPKMKVMGIEIVRSSTPSVVKDFLKEAVKICLSGTELDLQRFVKETKKKFMQLNYTAVSFPTGCNGLTTYSNNASIYNKGCPIHVRAALMHNHLLTKLGLDSKYQPIGDGDKIKYLMLKMPNPIHENVIGYIGKMPREFGLEKYIDYNTQFAKAFLAPLEKILDAIGWSAEEKVLLDFD